MSLIKEQGITAPFRSAVDIEEYQMVPILRALRMPCVDLLLADDVGLGKTSRRFAEWEFTRHLIDKELNEGDVFVADGTLQTGFPNEEKYLN